MIGAGSIILPNVRIGNNVVIAAGSIVSKDIPDNSVAGGVPAKVICTIENLIEKRAKVKNLPPDQLWKEFYERKNLE